jgi:hypothetical protein
VVVCDVTDCDESVLCDDVLDDARLDDALLDVDLVLAAVCVVVAVGWSRHASTPPSESIAATLIAVAALRAPAARGVRRRRRGEVRVGSSMTVNVRTSGERLTRAE